MHKTRTHGFSLIELILVVSVIAILAALLYPSFREMRQRSANVGCLSQMRSVYTAVMAYRADHNGYMPPGYLLQYRDDAGYNLKAALQPDYLKTFPYCPLFQLTATGRNNLKGKSEKQRLGEIGSYGVNSYLSYSKLEALPDQHWPWGYPGASRVVMIIESYSFTPNYSRDHLGFTLNGADWGGINVAGRDHGGKKLNFMMLDGSAVPLAPVVRPDGSYNWDDVLDSWGRDGKYAESRRVMTTP